MEPREVPVPLLRPLARAIRRHWGDPANPEPYNLNDAEAFLKCLAAEHLKLVPDDIDEDLTNSEEGVM